MPKKPATPCSQPGCPALTFDRFCSEHQREDNRNYERYQRDPAIAKRYGRRWRKIRATYITQHPLCEDCLEQGRHTPVEEVHHVLPLEHGGTHSFDNLRSLCKPCHSQQTAIDGDRWRNKPQVYTY